MSGANQERELLREALGDGPIDEAAHRRYMKQVEHQEILKALNYRDEMRAAAVGAGDKARIAERDRCLKICSLFPENLMAKHIAELIRKG